MSLRQRHITYLFDSGVTPRLNGILQDMCAEQPWPKDPLMYILHRLGCPLIPIDEMDALERQVAKACDELRRLQRILCDMGFEHECQYVLDADVAYDQALADDERGYCDGDGDGVNTRLNIMNSQTSIMQNGQPIQYLLNEDEDKPCCSRAVYG